MRSARHARPGSAAAVLTVLLLILTLPLLDVLMPLRDPLAPVPLPMRPATLDEIPWTYSQRVDLSRIGEVVFGDASWLVPSAHAQIGGGIFGTPKVAQTLTVGPSGSQFRAVCGRGPGTAIGQANTCSAPQVDCAPGSALKSFSDSSASKPYLIVINPGVYNECIVFDNRGYIEVFNQGIIRPTITPTTTLTHNRTNIDGGVVRIGSITTTPRNTHHITWTGLGATGGSRVHCDSFDSPEAAFQLNRESPTPGNDSTWDFVLIRNEFAAGLHDTFQAAGDLRTTTGSGPPFWMLQNVRGVGGRDNLIAKGSQHLMAGNSIFETITNWCESTQTSLLGTIGPQAAEVDADNPSVILAGPHQGQAVNFWQARYLTVTDADGGGGGTCGTANANVHGPVLIQDSDPNLILTSGIVEDDAVGCAYTISGVANYENPECNDKVWRNMVRSPTWKVTGLHTRGQSSGITNVGESRTEISNSSFRIELNDLWPEAAVGGSGCDDQSWVAGVLAYTASATERIGELLLNNVDISIDINVDNPIANTGSNCAWIVGGVVHGDQAQVDGTFSLRGVQIEVNNNADPNTRVAGVASTSDATGTMLLEDVTIDLNNLGGFTGDSKHIAQTSASTISVVGSATSQELMTTAGTITGWSEKCMEIENGGNTAYTDRQIPWTDTLVGYRVAYAACRCFGTCGASESVLLEDDGNNQIGAANIACVDNTTALSWTDVRTDADGLLLPGTFTRATNGTLSGTVGDDMMVCIRPITTRFAP